GEPKNRPMPTVFKLSQNSPNPASGRTKIDYQLPQSAQVSLVIYNILGQEVRRYGLGVQQPGYYTVDWNGKDTQGRKVSAGVYLYRLQAGSNTAIKKMTVLR
ncbi:MAG: FlgD immunoglobulin-like domain containing protein, partial [bacterium]|nr:FlgD immunoglobulin-like domain containing protein [bacterium]